jgi:hypothetical protein
MFLSKSLNYNGKELLWKTSMSREEGNENHESHGNAMERDDAL